MNIYEQAEMMDADYYDFHTGNTYMIQEYNRAKKLGLPTKGIRVVGPDGNTIGYALDNRKEEAV